MYDLHCHILPGVDDGAKSPDDTLEMARVAAEQGTEAILATPHLRDVTARSSVSQVRSLLDEVNGRLESKGIGLKLLLGMENHLDVDLPEEVSQGRALPMNGSRYILVEMPFSGRPNYAEDSLFQLQLQGLVPVLAHPERIQAFQDDPSFLAGLVERGMLSQITAGSLLGHFGGKVRRFTVSLLRQGLVHVMASDAHFPTGPRSPALRPGVEAAASILGVERAESMVTETPKSIVDDLPLEVRPARETERPRRWWRIWGA